MSQFKMLVAQLKSKDANPFIQFIKYGICGGIATATHMATFFLLSATLIPALSGDDFVVKMLGIETSVISDSLRARNFAINYVIAFMLANFVAYVLNILWVFKRGKYHWKIELLMFYAVSGFAALVGTLAGPALILLFSLSTTFVFVVNVFASIMINYALRKFVIFNG